MNDPLKAITLHEPYATAMAIGFKKNETRGRLTHHRGDLVICSARRPIDQNDLALARETGIPLTALKFGFALCIVEIHTCLPTGIIGELSDLERKLGNYERGRYAWCSRNLRRLREPVPVIGHQGHQGFFYLTPETSTAVRQQI